MTNKTNKLKMPSKHQPWIDAVKAGYDSPKKLAEVMGHSKSNTETKIKTLLKNGYIKSVGFGKYAYVYDATPRIEEKTGSYFIERIDPQTQSAMFASGRSFVPRRSEASKYGYASAVNAMASLQGQFRNFEFNVHRFAV